MTSNPLSPNPATPNSPSKKQFPINFSCNFLGLFNTALNMPAKPLETKSKKASDLPKTNAALNKAKAVQNDEFYTQLGDIENELKHYKSHLKGKVVFCNCDDPYESHFFEYFALNFNALGLKKLIATSYQKSPIVGGQLPLFEIEGLKPEGKDPYAIEINEVPDHKKRGTTDLSDVKFLLKNKKNAAWTLKPDSFYGAGDFRSKECVELLKSADVVVTNPPFSLFREFVAQLAEFKKKFLIIGNKNSITYKEVFALIKNNKMWVGVTPMGRELYFDVPEKYAEAMRAGETGWRSFHFVKGVIKGRAAAIWFTNLDNSKRHEELALGETFSRTKYPKYDNFDAIEVSKVLEIPMDYEHTMGVPVTFLDKYNPEQFEILGDERDLGVPRGRGYIDGNRMYSRIFIKRKTP